MWFWIAATYLYIVLPARLIELSLTAKKEISRVDGQDRKAGRDMVQPISKIEYADLLFENFHPPFLNLKATLHLSN